MSHDPRRARAAPDLSSASGLPHPRLSTVALVLATAFLGACGDGDEPAGGSPASVLQRALDAMGGATALAAASGYRISGSGRRFEPGQSISPEDDPLLGPELGFELQTDEIQGRSRRTVIREPGPPFQLPFEYAELVDPGSGLFDGVHGFVSGVVSLEELPMSPERLAATRRRDALLQPQTLLLHAAERASEVQDARDEIFRGRAHHVVEVADGAEGSTGYRAFLDAETLLPSKVEALEDDPVLGDVLLEVRFDAWVQHGPVRLPEHVETHLAGTLVGEETREAMALDAPLDEPLFPLPAGEGAEGPAARSGRQRSAFYDRYLAMGLDFDSFPAGPEPVVVTEVAPGVHHVTGAIHHSLAIELDHDLLVVEAPIDDARSLAVMAALTARFPAKPVRYLVNTHHHHDHSGGVRAYIAGGATLVTAAANRDFFTAMVDAPHTVQPDALAMAPAELDVLPVYDDVLTISDGREVQVIPVLNRHASGMLMVFVPDAGVLFQSDLYAPGLGKAGAALENPPVPAMFVDGAVDLYQALSSNQLEVDLIVGGHGFGAATMDDLRAHAGAAPR
jgi:glyoxylase-like metal-dependent hydrolase (beta-lactamase superfamily II)